MESRYGWVLVALGGLMGCVAVGAMFSLAVFLEPMSVETGWGRAGISSAMTLNFIAMGLGSGLRIILVNVALSPIYLALLITGVGTAIAFFIVNSWLLGRDLGDMVAARHMKYGELPKWRSRTVLRRLILACSAPGSCSCPC